MYTSSLKLPTVRTESGLILLSPVAIQSSQHINAQTSKMLSENYAENLSL